MAGQTNPDNTGWGIAIRDVLVVLGVVVAAVLGAAILTGILPDGLRRVILDTPLTIVVLVVVTTWILWRIAGRTPPEA